MLAVFLLATAIALLSYAIVKFITRDHDFFTKQGIKQMQPVFLFGNMSDIIRKRFTAPEFARHFYDAFPNEKVNGLFEFMAPIYLLRDVNIIKQLNVKDFDHFENHRSLFDEQSQDFISNSLFFMKGQTWRDMRATLSPSFTSTKMRQMFELISDCADNLVEHFQAPWMILKLLSLRSLPQLASKLNIEMVDKKNSSFFHSMVLDTMDLHTKGTQPANEDLASNANDSSATAEESSIGKAIVKRKWTDVQIVSQCLLFFVAGFDTTTSLLTMLAYELSLNPDVQQKLYEEIKSTHESCNGKRLDYDTLLKMKYLDQVISETLRKWPPVVVSDRACVKDYKFDDGDLKLNIKKGASLYVPIYSIHHDSKYFRDPEIFEPERFSDENKGDIVPGSFMPFGVGPLNCIGSRFALMEVKAVFYHILLKFSMEPNEKSEIPVVLDTAPFNLPPKNGIHLRLKGRG